MCVLISGVMDFLRRMNGEHNTSYTYTQTDTHIHKTLTQPKSHSRPSNSRGPALLKPADPTLIPQHGDNPTILNLLNSTPRHTHGAEPKVSPEGGQVNPVPVAIKGGSVCPRPPLTDKRLQIDLCENA